MKHTVILSTFLFSALATNPINANDLLLFILRSFYGWASDHNIVEAAARGNIETVKNLINQGVNVNSIDEDNAFCHRIPLQRAANYGHATVVKLLLEHGANIHEKDYYGYPVTMCPIPYSEPETQSIKNDRIATLQILLEHGAEVTLQTLCHATYAGQKEMAEQLIKYGAPTTGTCNIYGQPGRSIESLAKEKGFQTLFNIRETKDEETLSYQLSAAVSANDLNNVEALLNKGANPDKYFNSKGQLPLHIAIANRFIPTARALLNHGASPDIYDQESDILGGTSPLGLAIKERFEYEDVILVDLLLEKGANSNIPVFKNAPHMTPLRRALWVGFRWSYLDADIIKIMTSLIAKGATIPSKEDIEDEQYQTLQEIIHEQGDLKK